MSVNWRMSRLAAGLGSSTSDTLSADALPLPGSPVGRDAFSGSVGRHPGHRAPPPRLLRPLLPAPGSRQLLLAQTLAVVADHEAAAVEGVGGAAHDVGQVAVAAQPLARHEARAVRGVRHQVLARVRRRVLARAQLVQIHGGRGGCEGRGPADGCCGSLCR